VHSDDRQQAGARAPSDENLLVIEGLEVTLDRRGAQWPAAGVPLPGFELGPLEVVELPVPVGVADVLDVVPLAVPELPAGVLVDVPAPAVEVAVEPDEPAVVALDAEPAADVDDDVPLAGGLALLPGGSGPTPSAASAAAERAPSAIAAAVASAAGLRRVEW
jgi:hypothetical protein